MSFAFLQPALEECDAALDYYIKRNEQVVRAFSAEFEASVEQIVSSPTR